MMQYILTEEELKALTDGSHTKVLQAENEALKGEITRIKKTLHTFLNPARASLMQDPLEIQKSIVLTYGLMAFEEPERILLQRIIQGRA